MIALLMDEESGRKGAVDIIHLQGTNVFEPE